MTRPRATSQLPASATPFRLAPFVVFLLLMLGSGVLRAAPRVDVVPANLSTLIDRAAKSPSRFAVDVPYAASPSTAGEWTSSGDRRTWTYSAQIPGAVSMSFHATEALLPASATLTVIAAGAAYVYTSKDAHGGELWSRIGRGDLLTFELNVAAEDADRVRLEIASLQAGYRGLGAGVPNHPHYDELRKQALSTMAGTASCAENWTCHVTAENAGPGNATAALIIANVDQCTGVLLNDVPGDGTPYLLTARHCENGSSDGGSPDVAANVMVYWNVVSACGEPLGSIYDPGIVTQYGADTVVEQQDAWLIRLRQPPLVYAYYAGWDATGGTFVGGYTPQHASGTSRQFTGWYGQAVYFTVPAASLGVQYDSTFWGTVNEVGAGGPGASGAGLFDATGRLVGTLVRGLESQDGTGVCPATPPPTPTQSTATAWSTAFSGVFASLADPGTSTGTATLQSVLDPNQTGTLVLDGQAHITVTLSNYTETFPTGTRIPLDWSSSPGATTCTASGGETGDGWAGSVPTIGSKDVTSFDGGDVTYTLTCTDGVRTGTASVTVHWTLSPPSVSLTGNFRPDYGVPFGVDWRSNVRPCTATDGTAGDGWSGSVDPNGTAWITENVVGSVTYTLTCGSGDRLTSTQLTVTVAAPLVSMQADAVKLRLGQPVNIATFHQGGPCVKTGGAAGDGWADTLPIDSTGATFSITESSPGTYTYTMACGSGSYVATGDVTVTFSDEAPAVSVQANPGTGVVKQDLVDVSWDSNIRPCQMKIDGPTGLVYDAPVAPHGSISEQELVIGQYVVNVTCGSDAETAQASTVMNWTGTPAVQLSAPTGAVRGALFSMFYSSNVVPCTTSGGSPGDGWAGQFNQAFHDIQLVEQDAGTQTYTVTCGTSGETVTDTVSVDIVADAPQVTLTADPERQVTGEPVTLTWSSNTSPCVALDAYPGDGWTGTFGSTGSVTVTEQMAGTMFYAINCGTGSLTAYGSVGVIYGDIPAPTLAASQTMVTVGDLVTFTWASTDGSTCFATGGTGNADGWYGDQPASGSVTVRMTSVGTVYFGLKCGQSLEAVVQIEVNPVPTGPNPPFVTLTANASSLTVGDLLILTWTASNADSCTTSGGLSDDGWAGIADKQGGSKTIHETVDGVLVYTITCLGAGGTMAEASQTITVSRSIAAPSSGGGGSTGAIDMAFLLALALLSAWQRRRRPQQPPASRFA